MMFMILKLMMLNLLTFFFLILMIMVGVAYLTLLERKLLGYIQYRKGPNISSFAGLMQPFSDALKLMTKEFNILLKTNYIFFYYSPFMMLVMMMLLWLIFPFMTGSLFFNYDLLYIFCCLSLNSYFIIISGWASNSSYSMLGAIRCVAQLISYEISFFLILFNLILIIFSMNFYKFIFYQSGWCFFFTHFFLFVFYLVSVLAELNRTPFDLIEGESELVSGFNVEYFGMSFAMIFLAEYGNIMFMSLMTSVLFFGISIFSFFFFFFFMLFNFFIIWIRGVLPRMRFDELMFMCWKILLPLSLFFLMTTFMLKYVYL
uniref:NADH-ubiquinone oxidoreductase chain 1 n=1 Tax=Sceliphron madraspatanum TaxID=2008740 RepID=A0A343DRG5_9HYME|nr:NADH dehydrogenase subunit 1 [Sceliphron madraspatanum]